MTFPSKTAPPLQGLHHAAYRCKDSEATREFYEDKLGFPLIAAFEGNELPSTKMPIKFLHTFFDIGSHSDIAEENNHIAFFEVPDNDFEFKEEWGLDLHFAMRVPDHAALEKWKEHLTAHGVKWRGPIDHGICSSIYFPDPNGYLLEFAAENDAEKAVFNQHRRDARKHMQAWNEAKKAAEEEIA
jgi:catechol 2,3-dioxygenase-like lactoylglutathione lyase family enzyme